MRVKNLFLVELGRQLHSDSIRVKSEQTQKDIIEIEESENKYSIMGDVTSEGEYKDVSDSDSVLNLRKINIIVL